MKKIITTVGLSLLEKLKIKFPNHLKKSFSNWETYVDNINELKEKIEREVPNLPKENLCAEIQTLLVIKKEYGAIETELICTDTILSVICADVIKSVLESCGVAVHFGHSEKHIINGLAVEGANVATTFSEIGFPKLIERIKDIENEYTEENRPILNISGGYKALIPVMTIMGQLYDMEVCYMYEDSEEIIRIESMPINFDWSVGEIYQQYLSKEGLKSINNHQGMLTEMRKMGLVRKNEYKPTIIGSLFRDYSNDKISEKSSTFGYLVELKAYQYFVKKHKPTRDDICQGHRIWWNKNDKTQYHHEPQFNQDSNKERAIDIDIWIKKEDQSEAWMEVKSYSETGIDKAKSQIQTMLAFASTTNYTHLKGIDLLLYKLPNVEADLFDEKLKSIKTLFNMNPGIAFSVFYIEVPNNHKGLYNSKKFFETTLNIQPKIV